MATWGDVAVDNYRTAVELFGAGGSRYRSSISRFYYAAFSLVTYELMRQNAPFHAGRATPSHNELPGLIQIHLTQFSEKRRGNLAQTMSELYRDRLGADYSVLRVDKAAARELYRRATRVLTYFGVKL